MSDNTQQQPQQAAPAANANEQRVTAADLAERYPDFGGPFAVSGD